jgi:hypothetical protein
VGRGEGWGGGAEVILPTPAPHTMPLGLAAVVPLLSLLVAASAIDVYVSTKGQDTPGGGSKMQPFATISYAKVWCRWAAAA